MVSAVANSFLIVVLPLYIGQVVALPGFVGRTISIGAIQFDITKGLLIGIVLSLFGFLNSLGQPFVGRLSDRTGRRKVFILFGLGLVGIGSVGFLFLTDYVSILLLRALQGVGAAFTIPMTVALVNEYSVPAHRGENFGLFNAFRLLGFGIGPIVAGVVVSFGPYQLTSVTLSGFEAAFLVSVLGVVASFVLIDRLINDPEELEAQADDDTPSLRDRSASTGVDPIIALGLATIMMSVTIGIFAPLANTINDRLSQGELLFSLQFGAEVLASVLLQIPVGWLSDRYGRRQFILGGFVLLLPSTLFQGFTGSSEVMLALRFIQGVAVALAFAPSLAIAGEIAKDGQSGSTLSILTMGFGFGIALGTLFSGVLVGFGFAVPFVMATIGGVAGLLLIYAYVPEPTTYTSPTPPASD